MFGKSYDLRRHENEYYISEQSPRYNNVIPLYFTQNSDTKNLNFKINTRNVTSSQNPSRAQLLRHFISLIQSMAAQSSRKENPSDFDSIHEVSTPRQLEEGNSNASELVKSIFADPDALQLLRSALANPSERVHDKAPNGTNSGVSTAPYIEPEVQIINARATKAQDTARTIEQTVSEENLNSQTSAKRRRTHEYAEADQQNEGEIEEFDDELASPASRWQASPELTNLIESLRKPLQSFDRKTICRKYPRPDVEAAYTPALDNYLCSLVSGVKQADKDGRFIQDRVLDILGPMSFIYEHLNLILNQSDEGNSITLSHEQVKGLFNATYNSMLLVGNASALLSKERRNLVLKKINSKGTLTSLASEEFPDAKKNLFGDGFEERLKARSETAKTLFQASNVGKAPMFFRGSTTPFRSRGYRGGGAFRGAPRNRYSHSRGYPRSRGSWGRGFQSNATPNQRQ